MEVTYVDNVTPDTLPGTNPSFTVTPATKASIAVNQHSLMFVSRDFGNASSGYSGVLTILNNGSTPITSINTSISSDSGITLNNPPGCTTLTASSTCTETFSSSIPVDTDATIQLTPSNTSVSGNTVTIPVSGIGVIALAPPTDTAVDLTLVKNCSDTTNDGGLVMVTNNSSHTLSNISISAATGLSATITNPAFSEFNNVYCNENQLPPNGYCEFRVSSTALDGTTGEIPIFATLAKSNNTISSAHLYAVQTKVVAVAAASSFPYTVSTNLSNGGFIFVATNSCNLVQIWFWLNPNQGGNTWQNTATACKGSINSHSDWRLTDVGPTPTYSSSAKTPLTGEYSAYEGQAQAESTDLGGAWLFPFSATLGWQQQTNSQMTATNKSGISGAYVFCVRAFTTDSNGT